MLVLYFLVDERDFLLDTNLVPVMGYKLVTLSALEGRPLVYELVAANSEFDRWLNRIRERLEGRFNEVQNTGRNLERLLAKTVLGLPTGVIAKITGHLVKFILCKCYRADVQTFTRTA